MSTSPPLEPPVPGAVVPSGPPPPPPGGPASSLPPRPDREGSLRPLATWRTWQVILLYIGVLLVAGSLIGGVVEQLIPNGGTALLVANVLIDLTLLGTLVLWLRWRHPVWKKAIGWPQRGNRIREAAAGASRGTLLFFIINFGVAFALTALITAIIGHSPTTPVQLPSHLTSVGTVMAVLFAVVVAPITEEFFFRGCVYRSLRDHYGLWVGLLGSAALFGLVHIPLNGGLLRQQTILLEVTMVCTGLGLALIYERRGNLLASIAAHMAFNTIGIVLILWLR